MKKFNQKNVNRTIFRILSEAAEQNNAMSPAVNQDWNSQRDSTQMSKIVPERGNPGMTAEEDPEKLFREYLDKILPLYSEWVAWYRRTHPEDSDERRKSAWEALYRHLKQMMERGYTWHDIRKEIYRNSEGTTHQNYEDWPDWYHKENWEIYGNDKKKWDIAIFRSGN
jgi:hypothetical protein